MPNTKLELDYNSKQSHYYLYFCMITIITILQILLFRFYFYYYFFKLQIQKSLTAITLCTSFLVSSTFIIFFFKIVCCCGLNFGHFFKFNMTLQWVHEDEGKKKRRRKNMTTTNYSIKLFNKCIDIFVLYY